MRLTSKGRYAATAMIDMALNQETGPIPLAIISERQDISLSYLEQLFAKLKKAQLVNSSRGPGGGYSLARPTDEITIGQIISAVDEKLDARKCKGKANCQNGAKCLSHDLWNDLSEMIAEFLDQVSLQTLLERCRQGQQGERIEINFKVP